MNFKKQSWLCALWEIMTAAVQSRDGDEPLLQRAARFRRVILGRWYCEGCQKYHSGRVVQYSTGDLDFCYQAIRRDAQEAAEECERPLEQMICTFDSVYKGRRNIIKAVREAMKSGRFWR